MKKITLTAVVTIFLTDEEYAHDEAALVASEGQSIPQYLAEACKETLKDGIDFTECPDTTIHVAGVCEDIPDGTQ